MPIATPCRQTEHPLRQYRREHDLSQTELADRLGITQDAVSKIERYDRQPGPILARRIDRVTEGEIPCHQLRPDIWSPSDTTA